MAVKKFVFSPNTLSTDLFLQVISFLEKAVTFNVNGWGNQKKQTTASEVKITIQVQEKKL